MFRFRVEILFILYVFIVQNVRISTGKICLTACLHGRLMIALDVIDFLFVSPRFEPRASVNVVYVIF